MGASGARGGIRAVCPDENIVNANPYPVVPAFHVAVERLADRRRRPAP